MDNPWIGKTYLPDNTRMEVPPAWFLQAIYDYDSELVLFPSRNKPFAYVIARRLRHTRWTLKEIDVMTQPDTKLCMEHNLTPVCLMFKHGPVWDVTIVLAKLRARDLWAHGGAEKVADLLEQQEADEKAKVRADIRDDMWNRSGDGWRSYQARTGQRVSNPGLPGPSRPGAANETSSSSRTDTGPLVTLT
jgi:hypothetical protein